MEKNGNYYIVYWGYIRMMENGKENDNYYIVYGDFIRIMVKKMETGLPRTEEGAILSKHPFMLASPCTSS